MTAKDVFNKSLNAIEKAGNRLPDPAALFALLMFAVWGLSWLLSGANFPELDPRTQLPIKINNLLDGAAFTSYMSQMVGIFTSFPPLGVVLVAMLGLGVAEYTGYIGAAIRAIMSVTPRQLLTPVLVLVGVLSHVAVDAGYVLVIPLGGVVFYAAGRHPLAGVAAAFAGVSGGFSATLFIPSSLDPLLAGLTQASARLSALPGAQELVVSPLNNYFFTTASAFLVVLIGWFITDKLVEPRLAHVAVDGHKDELPKMEALRAEEKRALALATFSIFAALSVLLLSAYSPSSPWRSPAGELTNSAAPLMKSIVPLIFIFFLIPGVVYGCAAGTVKTHRDVIKGMTRSMSGMGYYVVMAFFCAQFVYAFGQSNIGALLSIKGANWLADMALPMGLTLTGIVLLSSLVNLLVGSASAKWALIGAVMVPMLMQLGISPDLTQAAYRVGDSSTNIITPLMPYFPLVVVFCQKYVRSTGIGTLIAIMLPYSVALLVLWTLFLLAFWWLGIPLGIGSSFVFPPAP
ncbi:MAG: AbgT transporter [Elusimicrobia bacterium]|nr:MAG: AbgT transporter [Elusimicrobiota bacterium]KAF0153658.1 MAG: AbgT transporter [Elusimicrobiota bacterium]